MTSERAATPQQGGQNRNLSRNMTVKGRKKQGGAGGGKERMPCRKIRGTMEGGREGAAVQMGGRWGE